MEIFLTNSIIIIVMGSLAFFILLCGTWAWMNYRNNERALIERSHTASLNADEIAQRREKNHPITRLNVWFDERLPGQYLRKQLADTTISLSAFEYVIAWFAIGLLLIYINALTFQYPALPTSVVIAASLTVAARIYIKRKRREYYALLEAQFVEFTRGMVSATRAGMSIAQGIQFTSTRLSFPAKDFFRQISSEVNLLNYTVIEALTRAEKRIDSRNFQVIVSAMLIHKKAGGNLVRALKTLVNVMQTRIDTQNEIDSLVNPLKATAILVILIPVVTVVGFVVTDETLQEAALHPIGIVLVIFFAAVSIFSYWLLQRMINIKA